MAEPDCPVDPPSVCDDGYCKVDGVYCENPAGSCYMENAWSACSCGNGTGSYGSGEPFLPRWIQIRAGSNGDRDVYQREIMIFDQVSHHSILEHVAVGRTLGRRVVESCVFQLFGMRRNLRPALC
jgi:hypothetical protein